MMRSILAALIMIGCALPAAAADRRNAAAASGIDAPRDCGVNGFALPGSAGCVRLAGSVAMTTTLRTGGAATQAPVRKPGFFTTHVNGRVAADIRVPTELGPFRLYTAVRIASPGSLDGTDRPR